MLPGAIALGQPISAKCTPQRRLTGCRRHTCRTIGGAVNSAGEGPSPLVARCGARTQDGSLCRNRVQRAGQRCRHHRGLSAGSAGRAADYHFAVDRVGGQVALLDGVAQGVVERRPLVPLRRPGGRLPGMGAGARGSASRTVAVSATQRSEAGAGSPVQGGGSVPRVPAGLVRELNRSAGQVDGPFDVIPGESTITSIGPAAVECGCVHL